MTTPVANSTPSQAVAAPSTSVAPAPAPVSAPHPFMGAPAHPAQTTALTLHPTNTPPPSAAGSIGGTLFALVLVLGLIFALAWLARRMPSISGQRSGGLRLMTSMSLGARERLLVVDVGGTQLLLSSGSTGTRLLHKLEQPLPQDAPASPITTPFAQVLAQHFRKSA